MLLSPSPSSSGAAPRISQILPTVKCSNCNQPVPLNELGDHICSVAPPVPPLPTNNSGGFKGRLQGLLSPPTTKPPSNPIPSPPTGPSPKTSVPPSKEQPAPTAQPSPPQPRRPSFASHRAGNTSFQSRSSPLARSFSEDSNDDYFSQKGDSSSSVNADSPPVRDRPGSHRPGVPSISSIRSAANSVMSSGSARLGSSGGSDTTRDRDTMNSMFAGNRNRDTVSSVGTARPSFISTGSSDGIPVAQGPPASLRTPTPQSPFKSTPKSPTFSRPPVSPRTPVSGMPSSTHPISVLSHASATSTMMASMASSSSSSSSPSKFNGQPLRSFSPSPSVSGMNRNMVESGGLVNRGVPVSNAPMSPRLPPTHLQSIPGRSPFLPGPSNFTGPPRTAYSPAPSINGPPLSPHLPFPGSRVNSMSPSIHQPEPDTKIGGEAGMAGVGRRGFAAAAMAALFTSNMAGHDVEGSRPMLGGPFLDIAAAVRSPVSPLTPLSTSPTSMNTLQASALDKNYGAESSFFDKFRDKIPGLGLGSESLAPSDDIPTARAGIGEGSATTPRAAPFRQNSNASEASTSSSSALTLNLSYSTSNASSKVKGPRRRTRKSSSNLPGVDEDGDTSGSEYGLAYADSTDYEDDDERDGSRFSVRSGASKMTARGSRDAITPKPGPRTDSLINSRPRAVSGSLYSDDEDDDNDLRNRLQSQSSPPANTNLSRAKSNASMSSVSSASSSSSAAAIAKALGLSRASMVSEGRRVMGGPGGPGIARTPSGSRIIGAAQRNRSATLDSAKSYRSDGAGRARSGTEGSVRAGGSMARSNKGDLEEAMKGLMSDTSSPLQPVRIGLRDDGPLTTVVPPLFDSPPSTRGSKMAHRSNTVGVTTPYTSAADAAKMLPKLPARSKTERGSKALHASTQQHYASPSVASSNDGTGKKKVRLCVRCSKRIEDGRWISIESPGVEDVHSGSSGEKGEKKGKSVLCESCWKNMYLPKCRRCNRPIEKQAVSSSDGQLKGKYHKDCFNCFTCNKPFPDKVFYVYDGRPLCKYHYHEANESLCAAATCGQPIEGPCAVSHTGDKYHPEHLTCEWDGYPKCEVRLNGEYWELEGRMLCERHAKGDIGRSSESGRDGGRRIEGEEGRARKRMTRFIDLGALGDLR